MLHINSISSSLLLFVVCFTVLPFCSKCPCWLYSCVPKDCLDPCLVRLAKRKPMSSNAKKRRKKKKIHAQVGIFQERVSWTWLETGSGTACWKLRVREQEQWEETFHFNQHVFNFHLLTSGFRSSSCLAMNRNATLTKDKLVAAKWGTDENGTRCMFNTNHFVFEHFHLI